MRSGVLNGGEDGEYNGVGFVGIQIYVYLYVCDVECIWQSSYIQWSTENSGRMTTFSIHHVDSL